MHELGRKFAPDARDGSFPLSSVLKPEVTTRTSRYWWANGWWGNQEQNPWCVEYSWHHWLSDGPVVQSNPPLWSAGDVYHEAQKVDEFDGEAYDGTSVRAGAKVLQSRGFISSYHWSSDLDTIVQALLTTGPVVVGTNWYSDMFNPDSTGLLTIGGGIAGGHAYLLDGVNQKTKMIRMKNSWGKGWGKAGLAKMSFDTLSRLLGEDGEACYAVEVKK